MNIYIGQARANFAAEGLDDDIQNIWGNTFCSAS